MRGPPMSDFLQRHIGPSAEAQSAMLAVLGYTALDQLIDATVPASIRTTQPLACGPALSEHEALQAVRGLALQNQLWRSYLGMGYHACITPAVIQRNILENPGWYTQYTPYQAEIAQGRLEALLNFQTLVSDLTALPVANASLLDEATAAAEAMTLSLNASTRDTRAYFVSSRCHPQTIAVIKTRTQALGIEVIVGDHEHYDFKTAVCGVLLQYPTTDGAILDYRPFIERAHAAGALVTLATDLLACTLLTPPGELGADIAIGSAQRFGVPMGYGGPHAAFMAVREPFKRLLPGRLVGISIDSQGQPALRLALQTREQHIRRAKATSNICTAQVLLAVMASMYAVYHGPKGLRAIADRIHARTAQLAAGAKRCGLQLTTEHFFDTLHISCPEAQAQTIYAAAAARQINVRRLDTGIAVSLDETTTEQDVAELIAIFNGGRAPTGTRDTPTTDDHIPTTLRRTTTYLTQPVFQRYHSETEMVRYIKRLESRDLSLTTSMIPLGSCTMKLNAAAEMLPITWPEFSQLHPFAPREQAAGYQQLITHFEQLIRDITGFAAVSLQPNAGSQGEYAGLLVIRAYHQQRGAATRNVCLIPDSAHGTNPASATMAGMQIVTVACRADGDIDVEDLRAKAAAHADRLAALMVTYPSTHGVFEEGIQELCAIVHRHGGQVYLDGANLNALVGLSKPAELGADVCHLNLHKTFCIPHGGGGPGVGPIAVATHLAPFLPGHPVVATGGELAIGAVAAAPWGSAGILPISYTYIRMMGGAGLTRATEIAILNANYIAARLAPYFPILFTGRNGRVAHECILDVRPLKGLAGIEVDNIAKRLMDFGFHAPTMSWPIAGTLMVEPTESESKEELDRFCEAMIAIHAEAHAIAQGTLDRADNPLKHAPHTAAMVTADAWPHAYSRQQAAYPLPWVQERKFWPAVSRINNPHGDRHFICTCQG
ncbi:MAG: aminomethyl-transferring glycine dehydrogenase [Deltaproteobacteria bacterium]|nr:aminomethyl-transferring glycine dehydrogenase [Deltaproteobacteria bacterium]